MATIIMATARKEEEERKARGRKESEHTLTRLLLTNGLHVPMSMPPSLQVRDLMVFLWGLGKLRHVES